MSRSPERGSRRCPVGELGTERLIQHERSPGARDAAAAAFTSWQGLLAAGLARHIGSAERAESLATLVIASIEGAVVLARAQRSTEPLRRVAEELEGALTTAIAV